MKIDTTDNHPPKPDAKTLSRIPCDQVVPGREETHQSKETIVEKDLAQRIFREGNGRGLIKFCRELSGVLIRRYMVEPDAASLRARLCASLVVTLQCTELQAQCLIDLSLELIHAKLHGEYRRSNVELSYLIATATGAVEDVGSN